ncbi:MAG TPA: nucleoside hydrolase [Xanthobacteraceae bacterium]|nr:nucleoside hydrolase [Xanthobacteraceae bacterium]
MPKPKILIDCDPGHDDLVAILFAARHLDLVGVTTVHGNNTLENTTRNGLIALELGGLDVPLAAGCSEPLVQPSVGIAAGHGKSGLDGAEFPAPVRKPIAAHAVDFIIAMAERHKEELILATIGPETNLALALRREPRLRRWVREITIMGGSTTTGNWSPAAEFNIACDVEAAAAVFESGIPLRMVGLNITRRTGFDEADIARMRASKRHAACAIADLMAFYLGRQRQFYGLNVAPMHDVCAIVPYVYPDLISYLHTSARIETTGTYSRGMTVCDLRHPSGSAEKTLRNRTEPNALVAVDANSRALIAAVLDTLLTYP